MIKRSLPIRILIISLVFLALPILIYFFFIFREEFNSQLRENYFSLLEKGTSRATEVKEIYQARIAIDKIIVDLLKLGDPATKLPDSAINDKLAELAEVGGFANLFYMSIMPDGKIIVTASAIKSMINADLTNFTYIHETLSRGHFGFLAYGANIDEKHFYVAQTVYSEKEHKPIGVFAVATQAEDLLDRMLLTRSLNYPLHYSLLTSDEIVFASSDPTFDLLLLKSLPPERIEEMKKGREIGAFITEKANVTFTPIKGLPGALEWQWQGLKRIGTKVPIQGMDATLLIYADELAIFKEQYNALFRFIFIFCLITALTGWLTFWITNRMAKPLKSLRWVMQRIGKGDYSTRFVEDRMGYEINEIGQTLNEMIVDLLNNMEQVKNERVEKETLANELKIGRAIQLSILPQKMPLSPDFEVAGLTLPAKEVGGDFYDFYHYPTSTGPGNNKLAFTIADAAGKGISACLYSLCLRSMWRSYVSQSQDVGEVSSMSNNLFYQDAEESSMFVTTFMGIYDPLAHQLDYTSAGHLPALLYRSDGTIERLATEDIALGVMIIDRASQKSAKLNSGDILILFTDGITEAFNAANEGYGLDRMVDVIKNNARNSAADICNAIVSDISTFVKDTPQSDDITLVVLRIL